MRVGLQNDAAAIASISPIWTAARNKLFFPKAAAAVAAISRLCMDANMIDEFHLAIRALELAGGRFRTLRPMRAITSV